MVEFVLMSILGVVSGCVVYVFSMEALDQRKESPERVAIPAALAVVGLIIFWATPPGDFVWWITGVVWDVVTNNFIPIALLVLLCGAGGVYFYFDHRQRNQDLRDI